MKKKILNLIYIILIVIVVCLLFRNISNHIFIKKYQNEQYDEKIVKTLAKLNFSQKYISNYNLGNVLYKNGKYEEAIVQYKNALKGNVPKTKECSIRINYALAICKTVKVDKQYEKSIDKAIEKYESAIDILTEKGCAGKDDNKGHNKKADKLKKDIEKEIEKLKRDKKKQNEKKDNDKEDKKDKNDEKKKDNKKSANEVEKEIEKIKEEAMGEQKEKEQIYNKTNRKPSKNPKNW